MPSIYCSLKAFNLQSILEFTEYSIDGDRALATAMADRIEGQQSVPKIFIQDQLVGGCNELYALEKEGKLDQLLQSNPQRV